MISRAPISRVLVATVLWLIPAAGNSQDSTATSDQPISQPINLINDSASNPSLFSFNYGIPTSPALALAGLGDANITPSTSLKPFVLSFPGLLNGESDASTVALEVAPAWLLGSDRSVSTADYRNRVLERIGFRTHLGLVLYKGEEAGSASTVGKPSRVAFALSASLLDDSDPLMAKVGTASGENYVWDDCKSRNKDSLNIVVRFSTPEQIKLARAYTVVDADLTAPSIHKPQPLPDKYRRDLLDLEEQLRTVAGVDTGGRYNGSNDDRARQDIKDFEAYKTTKVQAELEADTGAAKALEGCRKEASEAAQHAADIQVGAGVVWSGDPGRWANFGDPNAAVWASARYPLDDLFVTRMATDCTDSDRRSGAQLIFSCWMIGGSGRYSAGEMVATGDTGTPEFKANVLEGWLGLERIDSHSKFGGYFGYLQQHATESLQDQFSKGGTRWLVSAAYELGSIGVSLFPQGLWIQGSYGAANGTVTTLDDKVAMLTLSFGPPKIGSGFVTPPATSAGANETAPAQSNDAPPQEALPGG